MSFPPEYLEEIKARLRLSEVVGRTVALKRQGREFAGLSPFNAEKSPSFFVNDDKRFYHCFSSGKHGDVITWFMENEGLSFPEAVRRAGEEAGLPPPEPPTREAKERQERRKSLMQWVEDAHSFYHHELLSVRGAAARTYLEKRGLTRADWERYEIGYAPDGWRALKDHLINKGARPEELARAGLTATTERAKEPFDFFRDRITIAIRDAQRRMVGFGARTLDPQNSAKYVNSPECEIFDKGRLLYRYAEARAAFAKAPAAERPGGLLVTEGYFDAIACDRAGVGYAVAPLGTAFGEDQMELLWRVAGEPAVCFDGDKAGQRAAFRAAERALPHVGPGKSLRFIALEGGRDPDDILREEGPGGLRAALEQSRPLIDVVWAREIAAGPLDTPEHRAGLRQRLFALAKRIADEETQKQYRAALLDRYDETYGAQRRKPAPHRGGDRVAKTGRGSSSTAARRFDAEPGPTNEALARDTDAALLAMKADRLLFALLQRPRIVEFVLENLAAAAWPRTDQAALAEALCGFYDAGGFDSSGQAGPDEGPDTEIDPSGPIDKGALTVHLAQSGVGEAALRVRNNREIAVAMLFPPHASDAEAAACWLREAARLQDDISARERAQERRALVRARCASGDGGKVRAAARRDQPEGDDDDAETAALREDVDVLRQRMSDRVGAALAKKKRPRRS